MELNVIEIPVKFLQRKVKHFQTGFAFHQLKTFEILREPKAVLSTLTKSSYQQYWENQKQKDNPSETEQQTTIYNYNAGFYPAMWGDAISKPCLDFLLTTIKIQVDICVHFIRSENSFAC